MLKSLAEIIESLANGHTPCGDHEENGSGVGIIRAECGTLVCYRYDRPDSQDGNYMVTSWVTDPK